MQHVQWSVLVGDFFGVMICFMIKKPLLWKCLKEQMSEGYYWLETGGKISREVLFISSEWPSLDIFNKTGLASLASLLFPFLPLETQSCFFLLILNLLEVHFLLRMLFLRHILSWDWPLPEHILLNQSSHPSNNYIQACILGRSMN